MIALHARHFSTCTRVVGSFVLDSRQPAWAAAAPACWLLFAIRRNQHIAFNLWCMFSAIADEYFALDAAAACQCDTHIICKCTVILSLASNKTPFVR